MRSSSFTGVIDISAPSFQRDPSLSLALSLALLLSLLLSLSLSLSVPIINRQYFIILSTPLTACSLLLFDTHRISISPISIYLGESILLVGVVH
jgi:hypothetical protein